MKPSPSLGFTLVELIVVITILAILGTTGFLSLQNYSMKSRDSKRMADLQVLSKSLEVRIAAGNNLPDPDEKKVSFTLSGNTIQIQGTAGKNTLSALNIQSPLVDPLANNPYTYSVSGKQKQYQLYAELEGGPYAFSAPDLFITSIIPSVSAETGNRYPFLLGSTLGIATTSSGTTPINILDTTPASIEITTSTTDYAFYFEEKDKVIASGSMIYSQMSTRNKELSSETQYFKYDSSLLGYWTFNETTGTGVYDLGKGTNTGSILGSYTRTQGRFNKGIDFLANSYVTIPHNINLNVGDQSFSVSMWGNYRDYTYPKSGFMIKKAEQCYVPGKPGWAIGHTYVASGISVCYSDGVHGAYEQTVTFNPGYRPMDLRNSWGNIIVIFDTSTKRITFYVNGVKQTNTADISSVTGNVDNTDPLLIGTMHGWMTDGIVDDVRIYKRILESEEILHLANGQ